MINQLTKEIFKPINKNYERRKIIVSSPDIYWGADLVDMANFKQKNKGFTFLLNVIDLSSRYAWSVPLKSKNKTDVLEAFKSIIDTTKRHPAFLWIDQGTEFYNSDFKSYCKSQNIEMYSTTSSLKSVFVERFNRTMKEHITKYMALHNTPVYIKYLPEFMEEYNHTKHSSTKETPNNLYFNDGVNHQIIQKFKTHPKPKFKINDYVRLSKAKNIFEKGYTARYTHEVFKIVGIDESAFPYMYDLDDLMGERITGKAYEKELIKTEVPHFKIIDKVIKRKKEGNVKMVMVSYVGYGSKFDEWITETEYKKNKK